jgi:hypothetical protein
MGGRLLLCVSVTEVNSFQGTQQSKRPPPEEGNKSSFRNVIVFWFVEFRTMDKVQNPSNSDYYTPSPESFRFQQVIMTCEYAALSFALSDHDANQWSVPSPPNSLSTLVGLDTVVRNMTSAPLQHRT